MSDANTGTRTWQTRKWTRPEYDRLVECQIFTSEDRIELLGGEMVVKEPQHSPHAASVHMTAEALRLTFGHGFHVRVQAPVALDAESEPEPDVCVVAGTPRDYRDAHPERPVLIVEVSLSRIDFDRAHKGSLYARAGLAEYWIVNVADRRLEVYRGPVQDPGATFGWRYDAVLLIGPGQWIAPLAASGVEVLADDLFP